MARPHHLTTGALLAFILPLTACLLSAAQNDSRGRPWPLHVIDASSRGADGVRLADVNGDGLMDVTTGWEEGGLTRVYLHPGYQALGKPWPAVTVGKTPDVEDAVLVDLDADGRIDVVSSCEGRTRTMFVHWAPQAAARGLSRFSRSRGLSRFSRSRGLSRFSRSRGLSRFSRSRGLSRFSRSENGTVPLSDPSDQQEYLDPTAWETQPIPASQNRMMWMFCLPMQVDGRRGVDLVAGGKGAEAQIGWFEAPAEPRQLDQWKWHAVSPAGWIMSLRTMDVDGDGDLDVVTTDRKGPLRGCRWLENPGPGPAQTQPWKNHFVGGRQHEVMFMTVADLDADGRDDLLVATRPQPLLLFRRLPGQPPAWTPLSIALPENTGTGKGVAVGDVDRDGRPDVVFSCEDAGGGRSGVLWLSYKNSPAEKLWTPHELSGPRGIKFDLIELLDLDGDGDLDVLACEESEPVAGRRVGLGVFWYENPAVP